jgi:hypothetical protein
METISGNTVVLDKREVSNAVMLLASSRRPVAVVQDDYNSHHVAYVKREPEIQFVTARRPDTVTYVEKPAEVQQVIYVSPPPPVQTKRVIYPSTPAVDTRFLYKPAYLGRKQNNDYHQVSFGRDLALFYAFGQ